MAFCISPDFYPAYRRVKARIGQTPPISPSLYALYAPIRGVKIRWTHLRILKDEHFLLLPIPNNFLIVSSLEAALVRCCFSPTTAPTPTTPPHNRATQRIEDKMEVVIKDCADNSYVIEVGVDDTTETMRQKVASAVGLAEDSFHMGFGGKDEGDDITQLSAGDTIILTKSKKFVARAALHALGEDITAERLVTVEDAEVACLLLQAEVATVIPNRFLARTPLAQTALTALDLSAVSCVTEIGDEFLYQCTSLTSLDLSGLTRVTRIGNSFLLSCSSLTAVDLSPLSNVTHIDDWFLFFFFFCTQVAT